jgi:hypothetical protein
MINRGGRLIRNATQYEEEHEPSVRLEGDQLDQFLAIADRSDSRSHVRQMTLTIGVIVVLVVLLIFVIALCCLFLAYDKAEFLVPILTALGGLLMGSLGGFGMGRAYEREREG